MQLTKKQLKELISEEMETVANEADELDTLVESYAAGYDADENSVSKEALIDFLNVLEESRIPLSALEAFMQNLPENSVAPLLKEVLHNEE